MASGRDDGRADPAPGPNRPGQNGPHPRTGWGEIEDIDDRFTLPGGSRAGLMAEAGLGSAPARPLARFLGWCLTLVIVVPMVAGIALLAVRLVASLL